MMMLCSSCQLHCSGWVLYACNSVNARGVRMSFKARIGSVACLGLNKPAGITYQPRGV
jgi:hypothetical protein